ncbi:MAG TPA: peptidoglycan DD-metalloendopeptidase family protein [Burkholderiales bacterium]|nr:peptidoglycan DD-metalloendopeptidase family protein [Burkholderiales bacterium]
MTFFSSRPIGREIVAIGMTALLAACGSTPTAAPVIERSPNAVTAEKKAPAATSSTPAASRPTNAPPVIPPVPIAPPAPIQKSEKISAPAAEKPAVPAEEPTTKPYREGDWRPEYHVVKKGDTLYSIALDYGQDYRELAVWNNLDDPGLIKIDQRLRLFPPDSIGEATNVQPTPLAAPLAAPVFTEPRARKLPYSEQALAQLNMPAPKPPGATAPVPATSQPTVKSAAVPPTLAPVATPVQKDAPNGDGKMIWEWPAQGRLLYGFGQGPNQKGVGIEGRSGQPVLAAAPGKVVYSGSGLRGYGKLIIIKHNASYLSVYAHNSQILVKEGQTVAKGQKIAEIGDTDSDRIGLHFEIRRLGKPIDPLQYLPERAS